MNPRTYAIFKLYQLFNGIVFTGPIWAVYLLSRGFSLAQFGLVEAFLHVGMLAAQIPSGALADAIGRRRLLVAAGFFTAAAELGYVYAPTFALVCAAGAVHGVAFALRTGADEAYLFDALAGEEAHAHFPRLLGGLWAVFQCAGAISYAAGGLIASVSRPLAFWLTAGCALVASAVALRLPDDARGGARGSLGVAWRGVTALRRSPRLALFTLAWSLYWSVATAFWLYGPPFFQERGASDVVLGAALGASMLGGAGYSFVGGRLPGRVSLTATVSVATLASALGIAAGVAVPGLLGPILLVLIVGGMVELVYAPLSTYLQHNTESAYRATSKSIAEGAFSVQMLWLFPLAGLALDRLGWVLTFSAGSALLVLSGALFVLAQRLPGLPEGAPAEAVAA